MGKPFFDMVGLQRNIDFNDVGVILINDGEESRLPDELFKDYPYKVTNITIPHGGVSRARNAGLDASKADWVCVCDFDDQICSTMGLQLVFSAIYEDDKDMYWTRFLEEVPTDDGMRLVPHPRDFIFIHGRLYRRQWLVDNNIRFHDGLTYHEDCYFNQIAQTVCGEDRLGKIETGWYLWCYNENSVCRSKDNFLFRTYDHLMKQRNEVIREFQRRGLDTQAKIAVAKTVIDAYYDFQTYTWRIKEHAELYKEMERWFCTFLKKYGVLYSKCDTVAISKLAAGSREYHFKQGSLIMEVITIGDWLKHIMNDVKPYDIKVLDVER